MATYSGKDAFVSGMKYIQSWTATRSVTAQRHSHSGVAGATDVPAGIISWSGTITGVGADPTNGFPTGSNLGVQLVIKNSTPKISLVGNILIESLTIDANMATYAPFQWNATWSAQGNLAKSAVGTADLAAGSAENSKDLDILIDSSSITSGTAINTCLQSSQLVFRRPQSKFVCGGYTYSEAGNLEADFSFTVDETDIDLVTVNDYQPISMVVNGADDSWDVDAIRWLGLTGLSVNRTTNQVVGMTFGGEWTSAGSIVSPGGTTYHT